MQPNAVKKLTGLTILSLLASFLLETTPLSEQIFPLSQARVLAQVADVEQARELLKQGNEELEAGMTEEAILAFEQARRACGDNIACSGQTLEALGNAYFQQEDYEQAKDYYEQSLAIARQEEIWGLEAISLWGLGKIERATGDLGAAIDLYQESLDVLEAWLDQQ